MPIYEYQASGQTCCDHCTVRFEIMQKLTDDDLAAYEAPFPDARYRAGVRRFPDMVPDHPAAEGAEM